MLSDEYIVVKVGFPCRLSVSERGEGGTGATLRTPHINEILPGDIFAHLPANLPFGSSQQTHPRASRHHSLQAQYYPLPSLPKRRSQHALSEVPHRKLVLE